MYNLLLNLENLPSSEDFFSDIACLIYCRRVKALYNNIGDDADELSFNKIQ